MAVGGATAHAELRRGRGAEEGVKEESEVKEGVSQVVRKGEKKREKRTVIFGFRNNLSNT